MGMALSSFVVSHGTTLQTPELGGPLTWVEDVAQGAVVKYHNLAQIWLDLGKILDVSPVANSAVLSVISSCKVLALHLQPINDGISILLNGCGKYDQVVPFADLVYMLATPWQGQAKLLTFFKKSSQYGRLWT